MALSPVRELSPATGRPRVCAVVVNWNGLADTLDCLESLAELDYPNLDIVVVDNASADGSPQAIAARYPRAVLIQNEANLGYAGGNNAGIAAALDRGVEYVFLLNNDATVHPQALRRLVDVAESREEVGLVAPKIVYPGEPLRLWAAGMEVDGRSLNGSWLAPWEARRRKGWYTTLLSSCRGHNEADVGQFDVPCELTGASGCALLAKAEVFRRVGLFDEDYFLLFEDMDLCLRARSAGYRIIFVPTAVVEHKASRSLQGSQSPAALYYSTRNTLLFARRHGSGAARLYYELVAGGIFLAGSCRWLLRRDQGAFQRARAIADCWRGRLGKRL